jgi:hypothetical protein
MFNFAELDRLLGRDAMEDYFRQQGLDLGYLDWFLDYINTVTGLPGAVDTGEGGAGGTGGTGGGSLPPGETVFWSGTAQVASHDVPVRVTSDGTAWVQWGGKWRAVEMDANGRQYITVHDGKRRYFDVPVNFPKPPSQSGGSQGGGQAQTVKIKGKEYQTRTNAGGVQEVFFQNQYVSGQWLPVKTDSKGRKYIEWRLRVGPFSQKVKEYLD